MSKADRETVAAFLAAELATKSALFGVISAAAMRIAGKLDGRESARAALGAIREEVDQVNAQADDALVMALGESRTASRKQTALELVALSPLFKKVAPAILQAAPRAIAEDIVAAQVASRAVASSFGSTALNATLSWRRSGSEAGALRRAMTKVPEAMTSKVEMVAATENAAAFNGARQSLLEELKALAKGPEARPVPVPDVVPTITPTDDVVKASKELAKMLVRWNAELDLRTCDRCEAMHGKTAPLGELPEGESPPLHPKCRCYLSLESA